MPKIPRDINGVDLTKVLVRLGYVLVRQTGSHVRLTLSGKESTHHITIPVHNPLKTGTLKSILDDVGNALGISRIDLIKML